MELEFLGYQGQTLARHPIHECTKKNVLNGFCDQG